MNQDSLKARIADVLEALDYREREIIRLRYGLADGYAYTLEEVGKIFSVTRERVRQIETKAVRALQHPVRARQLSSFIERPIVALIEPPVTSNGNGARGRQLPSAVTVLGGLSALVSSRVPCPRLRGHVQVPRGKKFPLRRDFSVKASRWRSGGFFRGKDAIA